MQTNQTSNRHVMSPQPCNLMYWWAAFAMRARCPLRGAHVLGSGKASHPERSLISWKMMVESSRLIRSTSNFPQRQLRSRIR